MLKRKEKAPGVEERATGRMDCCMEHYIPIRYQITKGQNLRALEPFASRRPILDQTRK